MFMNLAFKSMAILGAMCIVVFGINHTSFAQTNPNLENGIKPFGSYDANSIDSISIANGALSLHIPLLSYMQRGNLQSLNYLISFGSKNFYIDPHCVTQSEEETCSPYWQLTFYDGTSTPSLGVSVLADNGVPGIFPKQITTLTGGQKFYQFSAVAGDRTEHPMYPSPFAAGFLSGDGSGFFCSGCNSTNISTAVSVYTRSGIKNGATSGIEDPNGNEENSSDTIARPIPTPTTITDFTGCAGSLPTTSASLLSLPGYNNGTTTTTMIKTCSATLTVLTAFNDSTYYDPAGNGAPWGAHATVPEAGGTQSVVQTVLLYDGSSWTSSPAWVFQYNNGQNGSGVVNYGDLTQVTLPTGGIIQYSWANYSMCGGGIPGVVDMSRGITQRITNAEDGSPAVVMTYNGGTTNDGVNDTVHTFTGIGGSCALYETQTQYYSGAEYY
jgi:hypothetical protein